MVLIVMATGCYVDDYGEDDDDIYDHVVDGNSCCGYGKARVNLLVWAADDCALSSNLNSFTFSRFKKIFMFLSHVIR